MNKKISYVVFSVAIALFVAGCSFKDVSSPVVKYTLDGTYLVQKEKITHDKVLKISQLKSQKHHKTNKIWYKKASLETNAYLYSTWNEDFNYLIAKNIANRVYTSNLFKSVFSKASKMRPDLVVEGEIIRSEQFIDATGKAIVLFDVRLYLVNLSNAKVLSSQDFSYSEKCESVDAKGAIVSFNSVVKKFNEDVVVWLKKSMI